MTTRNRRHQMELLESVQDIAVFLTWSLCNLSAVVTLELLQAITYLQVSHVGLTIDQPKIQTTDDELDVVLVDKKGVRFLPG